MILDFLRKWTLPCAIVFGSATYLLFSEVPSLTPIGDYVGPKLVSILPILVFVMLYVTFCKIQLHDLKPRPWHFILQGINIALSCLCVLLINLTDDAEHKLLLQGAFICIICPTAAAAPVITEKLGGSITSVILFLLITNCITALLIPVLFPLVEKNVEMSFFAAFLMVMKKVFSVLIAPLCMALLTRKFLPSVVEWLKARRNIAFYIWAINLSIVMGMTVKSIIHSDVSGNVLMALCCIPLVVSLLQFSLGKWIGRKYQDNISAGQSMGQKNTVVGIWLTVSFLNPYAAIAPCAYVVWQNMINSWQLWYKQKYGTLKW